MKAALSIILIATVISGCHSQDPTDSRPTCPGVECPNEKPEGGMFASADCSGDFCDCSYGVPYLLSCEAPLVFDEANQVCNWCYNMCDKCKDCGACKK
eukprot:TRINITY_DN2811_c0_g2_i1.p1 TRINITY_DN2811_c0_g2~~TRINITY_DN2811_c0_g2_i1.p1  ORF type:complete len:115 (+),score=31.99 TRINITY_DN2811_c0_g2_i1:52-345(+)